MNLVEKINQVKIKADTRISEADRAFCERQQRAYDAAREALKELDFTWTDCISQQKMILDGEQAYTYYLGNDRNLKAACFRDELERLHEHFINRLTSYFARTYSVDLSAQSITERLLPSNSSKGIFEREKAEEAEAAYHKAMRELALRYTDVLDQIFIQLGGRSFQEKAFWELQQRCCSAVWNTYKNEPQYVQQKDIIHFYCHFCSCDADWTPPRWSMTDRAKNVLWGVVHFETGSYTTVPAVLSDFFSYRDVRQACTDFHGYSKLRQIRLFKNGRMDIRFASSALAEQFIDIYLSAAYS